MGQRVDFNTIQSEELAQMLRNFYAEATPQVTTKRLTDLNENEAGEYHKNSMKSIRTAINRHLHDIDRDIDIVRDKIFKRANDVLDGKMKQNVREGVSRPTKHKEIISENDLNKIATYLKCDNPVTLRYKVWYDVAMHFVTRGLEFHEQLNMTSFVFENDDNGTEYATLSHETREKNWQGGLDGKENVADKRMYATSNDNCPVAALKKLMSKTDPGAAALFNHCAKDAPDSDIWFTTPPVKHYQFSRFMGDISRNARCSKPYTAHCLRATAIQGMSDAGYELRHIMYMSGHRNESSVRSYNRGCSEMQKKSISATLSSLSSGNATAVVPLTAQPAPPPPAHSPHWFRPHIRPLLPFLPRCHLIPVTSCHRDSFPIRTSVIVCSSSAEIR